MAMSDASRTHAKTSSGKILVAGATGDLGSAIVRTLLARNRSVRCLVRPQSKYQPLVEAGAEIVMGDLKDPKSLDPACWGVETVVTTANSVRRGGPDNTQSVDLEGNRNLIEAAKNAGVKHFIFISANTADPHSPVPLLQAKGKTEERLRESGMNYTIIAPNAYMEFWVANVVGLPAIKKQPVTIVGEGRRKHSFVSAADVAKLVIASIDNPKAMNQRFVIGGPQPVSFLDIIAAYERVLGRKITVQHVTPGQPVPGFNEDQRALLISFEMFDSPIDMADLIRTFDIKLTSVEEFAKNMASGFK
jgi:uncharacterized protein YbjT (DUF2867 family)